jgi:hypothetical protein
MVRSLPAIIWATGCLVALGAIAYPLAFSKSAPRIAYDARVDLGEREPGEVVAREVLISNVGGAPLEIKNVRTSCSCSGLEQSVNDRFEPVSELNIAPNTTARLRARLAARGLPGGVVSTTILFNTNDPMHPIGQLELYVSRIRGIQSTPTAVMFGLLAVGEKSKRTFTLTDVSGMPFSVTALSSSNPSQFTASLLASDHTQLGLPVREATLEVVPATTAVGDFLEQIRVQITSSACTKTVEVPVSARVSDPVQILPAVISLPRYSEPAPLYFTTCVCRAVWGQNLTVEPAEIPEGLSVVMSNSGETAPTRILRVSWQPTDSEAPVGPKTIKLNAVIDGRKFPLELRVNLDRKLHNANVRASQTTSP